MNWPLVLRRWLAAHGRHARLLLLLWLLRRAWRPLLRPLARGVHRALAAETPRLHYVPTPANARLLAACPALTHETYCPPWYLSSGHLQTLQLTRERDDAFPTVLYERQTLDMPDGGIVSLDWALPPRATDGSVPRVSSLDRRAPTVLLLPGLTGGSDEFYIRCVVHEMRAHGWQCVVLNARGCARTPLTTAQLFCCAYTDDLRFVLETFRDTYAFPTLVAAGFSMGSNVLVKYLGEYADAPLVTAGVSVGNPFDLVACAAHLRASAFYRLTYDKALNGNLQDLFFHRSNAHEAFRNDPRIDIRAIRAASNLTEFDDRLTRRIFNYESVHAYYSDASSVTRLARVSVPLLCLNAEDDPISVTIPVRQARENPRVILCVTKRGGHLGFYEDQGDAREPKQQSWAARAIAQFAESVRAHQSNETDTHVV